MLNQIPSHRRLLARLNLDLAELQGYPYPGVHVFIEEANFREFCFVLTPSSGPWSGLALNFAVTLPENRVCLPDYLLVVFNLLNYGLNEFSLVLHPV